MSASKMNLLTSKVAVLVLLLSAATASLSQAQSTGKWSLNFGAGTGVPGPNALAGLQAGAGAEFGLGYRMNPDWEVRFGAEDLMFQGTTSSVSASEIRLMPELRYHMGNGFFRPYLSAGYGLNLQMYSTSGGSQTSFYPDALLGLGMEWSLGKASLYVEGNYNLILASGSTQQDFPVMGGIRFDLDGAQSPGGLHANAALNLSSSKAALGTSSSQDKLGQTQSTILKVETNGQETVISGFNKGNFKMDLSPKDEAALKAIAQDLQKNPKKQLVIEGYSNKSSNSGDDQWMSKHRAQKVESFLIQQGVPKASIQSVNGLGSKTQVGDNATDEGRAANRRVVLRIVDAAK